MVRSVVFGRCKYQVNLSGVKRNSTFVKAMERRKIDYMVIMKRWGIDSGSLESGTHAQNRIYCTKSKLITTDENILFCSDWYEFIWAMAAPEIKICRKLWLLWNDITKRGKSTFWWKHVLAVKCFGDTMLYSWWIVITYGHAKPSDIIRILRDFGRNLNIISGGF
jgi:hypothetical protein